ncbi:LSU ribosomal protein L6p (L9e) [Richelia intracellularis HM01]|uniref:50S ribosomal protein L6 n=1 Tax=Richelia intracellularis TaxID=1164990 RepID=UPI0002B5ADBA|nr:50S ribosomal protein L6 [Richelia intracellularis]CCH66126.1 LSU ribosomal protein L6p (L9e) [Richelia intracellularis HM01]
MSRIGKRPISVPEKVQVIINSTNNIVVKGPKGELSRQLPVNINLSQEGELLMVNRRDDTHQSRQLHGLCRTLVANMIEGVTQGFQRRLEIIGVGYRAQLQGKSLVLNIGYSHQVQIAPPEGVEFAVENNTNVIVSGYDKELVGNTAAKIRGVRPPEPYKGKGIRYLGENVRRKAGKTGKGGKK